ncbi:hypothetical protein F7725_017364 [Dissostichus mawsoni]|uniref:Uncharacterized protein n=1 Tax=Dissostichus mawsoni TaxID=36200 RepID=A0A7J5Z674_DISMA|nr:hypothetical protein F7725_017364 [Dissostichus mawsoni]
MNHFDISHGRNVSPEVLYSFGEEENSFVLPFDHQSCRNSVLNEGTGDGIEIGLLLGLLEHCRISGGHHKVLQKSREGKVLTRVISVIQRLMQVLDVMFASAKHEPNQC